MSSPDKNEPRDRYPDRLYPPPSRRDWANWLVWTIASLGLFYGIFSSLPTPEELKILTSYTPTTPTRTPTKTPTPYPTGVTLTVYRAPRRRRLIPENTIPRYHSTVLFLDTSI